MSETKMNKKSDLLPVILAGGSGTRLWPVSRKHYAKQYLALDGATTMLQATVRRLDGIPHATPLLICNEDTRFLAAEQMRQIDCEDALILLEPAGRNTAPAIALAAIEAAENGDDPVLLVMAADHKICDESKFREAVSVAVEFAENGQLVTFGITPTHAETGYGYIKCGDGIAADKAFEVEAYVEKPNQETADKYLKTGGYFWNSGSFMFRASRFLEELEKYRPDILAACKKAYSGKEADLHFLRFDTEAFLACPSESVDYAVMEKTTDSVVVPLDAGWSDIGSWAALWAASPKDDDGNCEVGDVVNMGGTGNYINADSRLIAAVGCEDMVIIETKDTVFVSPKDKVNDVKLLVQKLTSEKRSEVDYHREVYRPWGKYDSIDMGDRYQVKRITVHPGAKLSVQRHNHRAEHWIVVRGTAHVTKGEETIMLTENESVYLPLGVVHALENPGKIPLELIEVQTGSYLGEDDIERFEDIYGRV